MRRTHCTSAPQVEYFLSHFHCIFARLEVVVLIPSASNIRANLSQMSGTTKIGFALSKYSFVDFVHKRWAAFEFNFFSLHYCRHKLTLWNVLCKFFVRDQNNKNRQVQVKNSLPSTSDRTIESILVWKSFQLNLISKPKQKYEKQIVAGLVKSLKLVVAFVRCQQTIHRT